MRGEIDFRCSGRGGSGGKGRIQDFRKEGVLQATPIYMWVWLRFCIATLYCSTGSQVKEKYPWV